MRLLAAAICLSAAAVEAHNRIVGVPLSLTVLASSSVRTADARLAGAAFDYGWPKTPENKLELTSKETYTKHLGDPLPGMAKREKEMKKVRDFSDSEHPHRHRAPAMRDGEGDDDDDLAKTWDEATTPPTPDPAVASTPTQAPTIAAPTQPPTPSPTPGATVVMDSHGHIIRRPDTGPGSAAEFAARPTPAPTEDAASQLKPNQGWGYNDGQYNPWLTKGNPYVQPDAGTGAGWGDDIKQSHGWQDGGCFLFGKPVACTENDDAADDDNDVAYVRLPLKSAKARQLHLHNAPMNKNQRVVVSRADNHGVYYGDEKKAGIQVRLKHHGKTTFKQFPARCPAEFDPAAGLHSAYSAAACCVVGKMLEVSEMFFAISTCKKFGESEAKDYCKPSFAYKASTISSTFESCCIFKDGGGIFEDPKQIKNTCWHDLVPSILVKPKLEQHFQACAQAHKNCDSAKSSLMQTWVALRNAAVSLYGRGSPGMVTHAARDLLTLKAGYPVVEYVNTHQAFAKYESDEQTSLKVGDR